MPAVREAPRIKFIAKGEGACLFMPGFRPAEVLYEGPRGVGKSRLLGEWAYRTLNEYPLSRILVVRKTRVSMNETFLKTWEVDVLPRPDWTAEIGRVSRRVREKYPFDNGSELLVAGMDQERLLGSEVDAIIVDEAIQFREVEIANLMPLLRNHKMPWQPLICATNPAGRNHWLNKRPDGGRMVRLKSRHEDNARYDQDPKFKEEYMETLRGLPPTLRKRWFDGEWVTQEGLLYPDWNPEIHVVDKKNVPPLRGYFGAIDWGYTPSPGVMQVWGKDDLDRIWLVAEVYKRKKHIDWWAARISELDEEFELERIVCDSAEPRSIDDLNKHLGPRRGRKVGSLAIKAEKAWETGHRKMCWYLSTDDRGPRMFVVDGCTRYGVDEELADEGRPTGFVMEMDEAVWAEPGSDGVAKDKVDKRCAVHALDTGRYAVMWSDGKRLSKSSKRGLEKLGPEALAMYKDLGPKWFWRYVKGLPGGWQGTPKDYDAGKS